MQGNVTELRKLGDGLTTDVLLTSLELVGRNNGPELVWALRAELARQPAVAAEGVSNAWVGAEYPLDCVHQDNWLHLFGIGGYAVDGVPADRPDSVPTLYRGARVERRCRWSWRPDRDLAVWFTQRVGDGSAVWKLDTVAPARVLARHEDIRPGEAEYVVDTRRLRIEMDELIADVVMA